MVGLGRGLCGRISCFGDGGFEDDGVEEVLLAEVGETWCGASDGDKRPGMSGMGTLPLF